MTFLGGSYITQSGEIVSVLEVAFFGREGGCYFCQGIETHTLYLIALEPQLLRRELRVGIEPSDICTDALFSQQ